MRIAILREEWIRHAEVGPDEVAVLAVLALHADPQGVCWPSQATMARLLGRSRPWVNRVIATLAELGLVEKEQRWRQDGGARACLYRLALPSPALGPKAGPGPEADQAGSAADRGCAAPSQRTGQPEPIQETGPLPAKPAAPVAAGPTPEGMGSDFVGQDWTPTPTDRRWAAERFPSIDLNAFTERFRAKCQAHGYRYADPAAAWRAWLIEDGNRPARRRGPPPPRHPVGKSAGREAGPGNGADRRFAVWAEVAAGFQSAGGVA
jgi:hypothetical protein